MPCKRVFAPPQGDVGFVPPTAAPGQLPPLLSAAQSRPKKLEKASLDKSRSRQRGNRITTKTVRKLPPRLPETCLRMLRFSFGYAKVVRALELISLSEFAAFATGPGENTLHSHTRRFSSQPPLWLIARRVCRKKLSSPLAWCPTRD